MEKKQNEIKSLKQDHIVNEHSSNTQINLINKRQIAKEHIINKFNLSEEDAEETLIKIEQRFGNQNSKNHFSSKDSKDQSKIESINLVENKKEESSFIKQENSVKTNDNSDNINVKSIFKPFSKIQNEDNTPNIDKNFESTIKQKPMENNIQSVDNILSDIIPNYNQTVSIEVNNVDLSFEITADRIDTIKENFIRTLKRNKSKKIKFQALKDISFKIYKGEKVGIIGYNGAGKSTLLNVICGIYPPDKGNVKTNGNISPLLSLGAGFDYNYSGRKNIFFNGAVLGYDKEFLESKVDEIIEFTELGDFIDIPVKNYSSGMVSKLSFSIATAVEPDILVIDEILGVGDVNFQKKSTDKIKSLMDGGTTVLFVSHSIPQVRSICDKAIWIDDGKIREIGEVNKICDHYLKDAEKASNEQLANIQFR